MAKYKTLQELIAAAEELKTHGKTLEFKENYRNVGFREGGVFHYISHKMLHEGIKKGDVFDGIYVLDEITDEFSDCINRILMLTGIQTKTYEKTMSLVDSNAELKSKGHELRCYDQPVRRKLGFFDVTTKTIHEIPLVEVRYGGMLAKNIADLIRTAIGRKQLFEGTHNVK